MKRVLPPLVALVALLALNRFLPTVLNPYYFQVLILVGINITLAVSLNLVNGFTGQFSIGHAGFMAAGAYGSAMFTVTWGQKLAAALAAAHVPAPVAQGALLLVSLLLGGGLAAIFGYLVGLPSLRLRGDYLAIVTLGFGEIIRVFLNNLDHPINITNGPKGIGPIDSMHVFGFEMGKRHELFGLDIPPVVNYYFLFLTLVIVSVVICYRLERSRIGRAWMAIREDEIAAKAMGINTRNMKLLAFGMGATFGGVAGVMFAGYQSFITPEAFSLQESIMIVAMVVLGGIGHIPGVIVGALLLAALPEVLRYVAGPLQAATDGRLDASILRQLLIATAMIVIMLLRPRGLWPSPEHGKAAPTPASK